MMRRFGRSVVLFAVIAVLASACSFTFTQNANYEVNSDGVSGVNATIYEMPTNQVAVLYDAICRRDVNCTATFLLTKVNISGWGAAEWHDALNHLRPSLAYEIQNTINQGALNNWNRGGPCLVLNAWIVTKLLPFVQIYEQLAWRTFGAGGSCKLGSALFS